MREDNSGKRMVTKVEGKMSGRWESERDTGGGIGVETLHTGTIIMMSLQCTGI